MGLSPQQAAAVKLAITRYGTVLYTKGLTAGAAEAANGTQTAAFAAEHELEHVADAEATDVWGLVDAFTDTPAKTPA